MENLAEALKIGFAIAFFVMALSLSMSSFSQAREAVDGIISARDRDVQMEMAMVGDDLGYQQYVYVEPTSNLTRTVGIETVISAINRAPDEIIEVQFLREVSSGTYDEFPVYYDINHQGVNVGELSTINPIRLYDEEGFGSVEEIRAFLILLLRGTGAITATTAKNCGIDPTILNEVYDEHKNKLIYTNGLYDELKDCEFEELLGEYYEGSGTTETKRVVMTYIIK